MESINHASGDNAAPETSRFTDDEKELTHKCDENTNIIEHSPNEALTGGTDYVTTKTIDENENKLKERISQCRSIIEALKMELRFEKAKVEKEIKRDQHTASATDSASKFLPGYNIGDKANDTSYLEDLQYVQNSSDIFSVNVESKLNCDEKLIEYEKQLEIYQNTLNMAQMEKKNAIRKQMLAKAFKLKLLEVENQCNIELLRVKQSFQCLEPLQMIANKWKKPRNEETVCDSNNYDLIPRYPELNISTTSDINSQQDDEVEPENIPNLLEDEKK